MDISLYGQKPWTNVFLLQVNGKEYSFESSINPCTEKNFRDLETSKIVARTYKGFRNFVGIPPASALSTRLREELAKAYRILEAYKPPKVVKINDAVCGGGQVYKSWGKGAYPYDCKLKDVYPDAEVYYGVDRNDWLTDRDFHKYRVEILEA